MTQTWHNVLFAHWPIPPEVLRPMIPACFDTERYCLYALDHRRCPYRGDIHHLPWPLQHAEATIQQNNMALARQIRLPEPAPLLHYAHYLKVLIWPPKQLPKP